MATLLNHIIDLAPEASGSGQNKGALAIAGVQSIVAGYTFFLTPQSRFFLLCQGPTNVDSGALNVDCRHQLFHNGWSLGLLAFVSAIMTILPLLVEAWRFRYGSWGIMLALMDLLEFKKLSHWASQEQEVKAEQAEGVANVEFLTNYNRDDLKLIIHGFLDKLQKDCSLQHISVLHLFLLLSSLIPLVLLFVPGVRQYEFGSTQASDMACSCKVPEYLLPSNSATTNSSVILSNSTLQKCEDPTLFPHRVAEKRSISKPNTVTCVINVSTPWLAWVVLITILLAIFINILNFTFYINSASKVKKALPELKAWKSNLAVPAFLAAGGSKTVLFLLAFHEIFSRPPPPPQQTPSADSETNTTGIVARLEL